MTPDEACLAAFQRELDIYRALHRLSTTPPELEDLAQDVFLALRRVWPRYDPSRPLRPYLFGFAFRLTATHQSNSRREVVIGVVARDDVPPSTDEFLQGKQARALLLAARERIPLPRRAALVMPDIDEGSVEQIESVVGIPLFTAYSRLSKARREFEAAVRHIMKEGDLK